MWQAIGERIGAVLVGPCLPPVRNPRLPVAVGPAFERRNRTSERICSVLPEWLWLSSTRSQLLIEGRCWQRPPSTLIPTIHPPLDTGHDQEVLISRPTTCQ